MSKSGFVFSPEARQDLLDLWEYVAENDVNAADRLRDALYEAIQNLVQMPGMGRMRDDLEANVSLRSWSVRSYLIIYRAQTDPLQIVRIVSGYRDVYALFN